MFQRKQLFRRVAIVGTGFMGASLGLAIKKRGLAKEIVGVGRNENSLRDAVKVGAIDESTTDFRKGIHAADFIVLATPVNAILDILESLKDFRRNVIITDLGSTKAAIVDRAEKVLHHSILFVGSHPLVGSEKRGPLHANAALYEGGTCIMTPTDKTNRLAREKTKHFWSQLGCSVKAMTPQEHDEQMAYISHLPHLAAYALVKILPEHSAELATQGLKDTTRVAASDPEMWRDIALSNPKYILKSLDEVVKVLSGMRKSIVTRDREALMDVFKQAKVKRERLEKAHGS